MHRSRLDTNIHTGYERMYFCNMIEGPHEPLHVLPNSIDSSLERLNGLFHIIRVALAGSLISSFS